ncbi:MAG: manganese efflux pump MntP family protein [Treponema sp.]|nr:manganese efflux pump MntP family protein [Treponema sp.]
MGLLEIALIAVSLSMDAFAVSITLGLSRKKQGLREIITPGLYFGLFQALMPTVGYFAGIYFSQKIQTMDHWIAFVLLGFIGGKMIKDSLSKKDNKEQEQYSLQFAKMIVLALATSIDALAIGITFAFFKVNIFFSAAIIGISTFFISMLGVKIGGIFGLRFKSKAEFAGGAVLVMLGIKIVIEHVFLSSTPLS